ncbi:MAG: agmatinase [Opitutales bacterium]|nr:agmatinase [Opitutales bacterium]
MTDKNTQFLGSELQGNENKKESSSFHFIPCPLEKTVSYWPGTAGGPDAIIQASHELERSPICEAGIFTQSPIDCSGEHLACLNELKRRTISVVSQKKFPVTLGGEHSLTWATVNGISEALGQKVGIIQVDAHADLRRNYMGDPHSHASVMNLLVSDGHPLASIGVRAICQEEIEFRENKGVISWDGEDLVRSNTNSVKLPEDFPERVYLSFDLDGLDPSVMPAVGTPVPGGLAYYQAIDLVSSSLEGRTCVGMDMVELAPVPNDRVSAFTAASLILKLLEIINESS